MEEKLNEENRVVFQGSTLLDERLLKRIALNSLAKLFTVCGVFALISLLALLISLFNLDKVKTLVFIPVVFLVFFALLIVMNVIVAVKRAKNFGKLKIRAEYEIYLDRVSVKRVLNDKDTDSYSCMFSEISSVNEDNECIYVYFKNKQALCIVKSDLKDMSVSVRNLLGLSMHLDGKAGSLPVWLRALFFANIIALFCSFIVLFLASTSSPIPEFPLSLGEYMWIFLIFLIFSVPSLVLGIVGLIKGIKCKKNIVAGGLISFFYLCFGILGISNNNICHDFDRFNQIKEELNLGFPETGNISYVTDGSDCEYFAMVKFDDREEIERIVNSFPFVEESIFYFEDEIPAYYSSVTSDYDRFLIFDRELGTFNTYVNGDSFYYLAYEENSNILVVCEFEGDEALNG